MANVVGGSVIWNLDVDKTKFDQGLASAKGNIDKFASDTDRSFSGIANSITSAFQRAEGASRAFAQGLTVVGLAGIAAVGFGVKMAADIETARQGFATLLGSAQKADEAIAMIKKDAAATPFEFSNLVRANQMLTSVTKNAPQSEKLLLNVGKALSAAGKSSTELDNVIVNLQQIANTAHISELDIRQFGFAGINILELLADFYGTTKEAAADMVKNSKNAFADLEGAFAKAGGAGGRFSRAFIDQAGTFNQLMSNFRDIVSQTAGDIVTSTGIFDNVKNAVGGITSALVEFKPQIVQGIKDFFTFISENGTLVTGIIVGGLIPAFAGLITNIVLGAIALAPFIAAGILLVAVAKAIIDALGGWQNALIVVQNAVSGLAAVYNATLGPALTMLWGSIKDNLLPALSELWRAISPVLLPALKTLAIIFGGVVIAAIVGAAAVITVIINAFSGLIFMVSAVINAVRGIDGAIRGALSGVFNALVSPFKSAFDWIKNAVSETVRKLNDLSPFTRHSPSLVQQITRGVDVIKAEFGTLKDISIPAVASAMPAPAFNQQAPMNFSSDFGVGSPSTTSNQEINIYIDKVNDKQDIDAIGRELGFRASLNK